MKRLSRYQKRSIVRTFESACFLVEWDDKCVVLDGDTTLSWTDAHSQATDIRRMIREEEAR